jgi:hypothetical protein
MSLTYIQQQERLIILLLLQRILSWVLHSAVFFIGLLVCMVLGFVLALLAIIGVVRFARTGSIGEAFNFNAIFATIGKIGWGGLSSSPPLS